MLNDASLPQAFQAIRDKDEQVLWAGQPDRLPFVLSGVPLLIFGLIWGSIDYFGFIRHMGGPHGIPLGFAVPFFALHLFPCWASVLNMIRLQLVVGNTYYAVTPKRLLLRSGFWGTDFGTFDLNQVANLDVNVNPIENAHGVGTIRFYSNRVTTNSGRQLLLASFVGIANPYDVYKIVRQAIDTKLPAVA
jgi:hypothetical protein